MRPETREKFDAFLDRQAELNRTRDTSKKFVVEPSVQQKLIDKQQESSEFLSKINIIPVIEKSEELLGLGVGGGTVSGRTDTDANDRTTQDPSGMDGRTYDCKQTNFDTHIKYSKLDAWAKFDDFQLRIQNQIIQKHALERIMIGFNGVSAAPATNRGTYPLLQDVNIGWLQKLRTEAPTHVMDDGAVPGHLTYGDGGDYATLDAMVYDAYNTLLPVWARKSTDLIAFVGNGLLHDKYFAQMDVDAAPTEQLAREIIMTTKRLGGLPAAVVPYFPDGKIFITTYKNLSLYEQEGGRRRTIVDNAKRDRIEDFQSSNDAYVNEDNDFVCLLENIENLAA